MNLLDCRAAFLFANGKQYGRYNYVAIAKFETATGFAYQKLYLKFQPFNSAYFIENFELNTEGAWKSQHSRSMNIPTNPLPENLQAEQWSAIRSVFDNYESLSVCVSERTGKPKNVKHFHVGDGQFFITEVEKIRSIDFTNFVNKFGEKAVVIAENGVVKY